jgi:hypothetical protein
LEDKVLQQKELERRAKERMSSNWKIVELGETGGSNEPVQMSQEEIEVKQLNETGDE